MHVRSCSQPNSGKKKRKTQTPPTITFNVGPYEYREAARMALLPELEVDHV